MNEDRPGARLSLREASTQDFSYCENLYFREMKGIIDELRLDMAKQVTSFRDQWKAPEVRIITLGGADIGWLQCRIQDDALFVAQLFVDPAFQRRGTGTAVMNRIIQEAAKAGKDITLGVVKTNPALHLYRRLGFQITHEDERKFYMRHEMAARDPGS